LCRVHCAQNKRISYCVIKSYYQRITLDSYIGMSLEINTHCDTHTHTHTHTATGNQLDPATSHYHSRAYQSVGEEVFKYTNFQMHQSGVQRTIALRIYNSTTTHYNILKHTTTQCNTLQHTPRRVLPFSIMCFAMSLSCALSLSLSLSLSRLLACSLSRFLSVCLCLNVSVFL